MRLKLFPNVLILTLLLWLLAPPALAAITERVSVSSAGAEGNVGGFYPSISADGRYVAFWSPGTNLVEGDTNSFIDVFVRDRQAETTERVSVSSAGAQGNWDSDYASISADGRYVAFCSGASNLVEGDTNGAADVFVRDREAGTTERVSVSSAGAEGDGGGYWPAISADGRYVAFSSGATNLVESDTNGVVDIFVRDRLAGTTERVSVSSAGAEGDYGGDYYPAISADGRYVAFFSEATNLVESDTNGVTDTFVRDRLAGTTERVSVSSAGAEGNGASYWPSISADGRYVAFHADADNLVEGDTNGAADVFVRDREAGATERVSVSTAGAEGNGASYYPSISGDGRHVAFYSGASTLVAGDSNICWDVFVRDRLLGTTERASVSSAGAEGNYDSWWPAISGDGRHVAFHSSASNLVAGDNNVAPDIFVRTRWGFRDVFSSYWAYDQINACVDANVVKGYPDGTYQPEWTVTRDQMAVYISRALVIPTGDAGIPDPEPPPSFSDVPADHWAYKWIEYAVSQNVVKGYDDGTYQPGQTVDRGQMAVYVARAMVAPTGDAAIPDPMPPATFPDVPDSYWAYKHIEYCVEQGVVRGYDDGLYHPEIVVTRDQMAVYVARAFALPLPTPRYNITDYFPLSEGNTWNYDSDAGVHTESVSGTVDVLGIQYRRVVSTQGETIFWASAPDGLRQGGRQEGTDTFTFDPPILIPNGLQVSDQGSIISALSMNGAAAGSMTTDYVFHGVETVTVPAGTFADCMKLEITITVDGVTQDHFYSWGAKGVGTVKQDSRPFGGTGWDELTSATVDGVSYPTEGASYALAD